jgi:hypothetical protein
MTLLPKQLQQAFRFTDKILRKPEIAKAINNPTGTYANLVKDVTSIAVDSVNQHSSKSIHLEAFYGVEDLWSRYSTALKQKYPHKTEAEIKKILSDAGAAHYSTLSVSKNKPVGYVLMNSVMPGNTQTQDLDIKMGLLHELTHAIDAHNASNLFKQATYLPQGQNISNLSKVDLQNALNMIYIKEHAHGKTIRILKKNLKSLQGQDKVNMQAVLNRHLDAMKPYGEDKRRIIQELKRRQGEVPRHDYQTSPQTRPNVFKWIAGALGLTAIGALSWQFFKPQKTQETLTAFPETLPPSNGAVYPALANEPAEVSTPVPLTYATDAFPLSPTQEGFVNPPSIWETSRYSDPQSA